MGYWICYFTDGTFDDFGKKCSYLENSETDHCVFFKKSSKRPTLAIVPLNQIKKMIFIENEEK